MSICDSCIMYFYIWFTSIYDYGSSLCMAHACIRFMHVVYLFMIHVYIWFMYDVSTYDSCVINLVSRIWRALYDSWRRYSRSFCLLAELDQAYVRACVYIQDVTCIRIRRCACYLAGYRKKMFHTHKHIHVCRRISISIYVSVCVYCERLRTRARSERGSLCLLC